MERIIDKTVVIAGSLACLIALGRVPGTADIACLLVGICCSALAESTAAGRHGWVRVAAGLLPCALAPWVPGGGAALALVLYGGAGTGLSEIRLAALAASAASLVSWGALQQPAPSGLAAVLLCMGFSALLGLRTRELLGRRASAQLDRDELTRESMLLAQSNRQLEDRLMSAQRGKAGPGALPQSFSRLTERELEVARLVAQGLDNKEIAAQAFMGEGTVRNHISSILAKTQLKNRTQIARALWEAEV